MISAQGIFEKGNKCATGAIIFYPTAFYLLENTNLGSISLIIATIASNFYGVFIAPYEYYKISKKELS